MRQCQRAGRTFPAPVGQVFHHIVTVGGRMFGRSYAWQWSSTLSFELQYVDFFPHSNIAFCRISFLLTSCKCAKQWRKRDF